LISGRHIWHKTKQTRNEVERSFYNLDEFAFEYFYDSRKKLASFANFFHQIAFCSMIVPSPLADTQHPARTRNPSFTHTCFLFDNNPVK